MFGLFKKKSPTALDAFIRLAYGDNPPAKSANLAEAIRIADEQLLLQKVSASEVERCAKGLFAGPVPYSTHDLAVSVALNFFKNPELLNQLKVAQSQARVIVASWAREGKVVGPLAQSFEAVLHNRYQSAAVTAADDEIKINQSKDDKNNGLAEKHQAFREQNKGASVHTAARAVKAFMVWQHNSYQSKKLETDRIDDEDEYSKEVEKQTERAFTLGAALAAIYAFSLPEDQRDLFLMNVVGMYLGISDHDHVDFEIKRMVEAANELKEASEAGTVLMMDYLVNGKQDNDKYGLASIMGVEG
jgi:hypothetical protein